MFIVSSDRESMVNAGNFARFCVNGKTVLASTLDNITVSIGAYESNERAKEVFKELTAAIANSKPIFFNNTIPSEDLINIFRGQTDSIAMYYEKMNIDAAIAVQVDKTIYYMPEE